MLTNRMVARLPVIASTAAIAASRWLCLPCQKGLRAKEVHRRQALWLCPDDRAASWYQPVASKESQHKSMADRKHGRHQLT
jgi:hypothetical protein